MTKYTETNVNWEAEQREGLIEESKQFIKFYTDRACHIEHRHPTWNEKQVKAKLRHYARQIAKHEAFLKSEGVEFRHTIIFC